MARGINKVILVAEYAGGDSIPVVASRHGVSQSTVRSAANAAGVLRSREEGIRLAAQQGRLGSGMKGARRSFADSHKAAMRVAAQARGERMAAGESLKPNGYVEITRGENKGRSKHRVVAEEMLGRAILPGEVVHHKDGNRANNSPSNLEVMTRAEHTSLHRRERH
jgi:hypothetical protein